LVIWATCISWYSFLLIRMTELKKAFPFMVWIYWSLVEQHVLFLHLFIMRLLTDFVVVCFWEFQNGYLKEVLYTVIMADRMFVLRRYPHGHNGWQNGYLKEVLYTVIMADRMFVLRRYPHGHNDWQNGYLKEVLYVHCHNGWQNVCLKEVSPRSQWLTEWLS
jgi:hypothetical protein